MRALVRWWRPLVPIALVVVLAAPLLWRLTTRPPTYPLREFLLDPAQSRNPRITELIPVGREGEAEIFHVQLATADAAALASFDHVRLLMLTHGEGSRLLRASLQIAGTGCRFEAAAGATIANDEYLTLDAVSCTPLVGTPTGDVLFEVVQLYSGRAAIWTFDYPPGGWQLRLGADPTRAVYGEVGRDSPPATRNRINLLAYTWNVTPSVLWARLRAVGVLICLGVWLLWPRPPLASSEWRRVTRAALGATLLMTGLALAHSMLFPPLQAPDEPDHLLSLAAMRGDAALTEDTAVLARRTHFERLRHQAAQHFRETDIRHPWPITWTNQVHVEPVELRSPLTAWWWAIADTARDRAIEQRLWALRRADALLFGLACGLAVALLASLLPRASAPALVLGPLAVPTLPFFGAEFSDTAVLVAVSVVVAACAAAVVIGTPRTQWLGLPLGLGIAGVILGGRRMWPLLMVIGAVLAGRAVTGSRSGREALRFWSGLAIGMLVAFWAAEKAGTFVYAASLVGRLPPALRPIGDAVTSHSWIVLMAPAVLGAVDLIVTRISRPAKPVLWFARGLAGVAIVWLIGGLVSSSVVPYATAPLALDPAAGLETYVRQVLASMAVPFRISHHDLMLSLLFWSGLGWSDTLPPEWLSSAVILATAAMCVWALVQAGRESPGRVIRIALLVAGLACALVLLTVGVFSLQYALYGRYLIGWYLFIVLLAWTAPAFSRWPTWPWLVAALAAHAYYLQLVPLRYF